MRYLLLILMLWPIMVSGQFDQGFAHFRDSLKREHPQNRVIVEKKMSGYYTVTARIQMDSFMQAVTDTAWICRSLYVAVRKAYSCMNAQVGQLTVEYWCKDQRVFYCDCYPNEGEYITRKQCWFYVLQKDGKKKNIE